MYSVLTNSCTTLDTVTTSIPGTLQQLSLIADSVGSLLSVVTNDEADTLFLLNVSYCIVARESVP